MTHKPTAEQLEGAALSAELARAFGRRVRRARIDAGLTPKDVEAKTKVSRTLLRQIEAGLDNPTLDTLAATARIVGMSVSELLALEE